MKFTVLSIITTLMFLGVFLVELPYMTSIDLPNFTLISKKKPIQNGGRKSKTRVKPRNSKKNSSYKKVERKYPTASRRIKNKGTTNRAYGTNRIKQSTVKIEGRGRTGRITPKNKAEVKALRSFTKNPNRGSKIVTPDLKIKDPRWQGWTKLRYSKNGVAIHFMRRYQNGRYRYDDVKFKDYEKPKSIRVYNGKKKRFVKTKIDLHKRLNYFNKINKNGYKITSPFSQFFQVTRKK
jgi:hypothetical protein